MLFSRASYICFLFYFFSSLCLAEFNAENCRPKYFDSKKNQWDYHEILKEVAHWRDSSDVWKAASLIERYVHDDFCLVHNNICINLITFKRKAPQDGYLGSSVGTYASQIIPICSEEGEIVSIIQLKKSLGEGNTWIDWLLASPKSLIKKDVSSCTMAADLIPTKISGAGKAAIKAAIQYSLSHKGNGNLKLNSTSSAASFYKKMGFRVERKFLGDVWTLDCKHCKDKLMGL